MEKEKLTLKEIQKIELDILIYLDQVCRDNNIKYYLSSGTLLGAVKYKGFIPWDDDIDVILLREDYQKLMDILKNETGRYQLLSIYNRKDYYYPFAKFVDSKTVLRENSKSIKEMGVYIDIVPMDGYVDDKFEKEVHNLRFIKNLMVRRFRIKKCIRYDFDYLKDERKKVTNKKIKDFVYMIIDIISRPLGYLFWVKLFDKKISKVSLEDAKYLGVKTGGFGIKEIFKKEEIIEQSKFLFEGYEFYSFKNYDLYLKSKFGDYKKEPKDEQKKSHHQFEAYWK